MPKTWFITGTSSGFGRIMTEKLLARGDKVVGTVRKPDALSDLTTRYGDRLTSMIVDLTDIASVRRAVDAAFTAGRIDVVVSNAAYGLFGAGEEVTDDQIRHQIDTNLIGSIQFIRATLPHLRTQGGGRIVQVSSEGGQIAYPNFSLYHATKWGIEGFVESVSQEVAPFGITFMLAEPGPSATDFSKGIVSAPVSETYENTPAGDVRRAIASGDFKITGDPVKMAQAMIEAVDRDVMPKRLALGSGTYTSIRTALEGRLAVLEAEKEITLSVDLDH